MLRKSEFTFESQVRNLKSDLTFYCRGDTLN